MRWTNVATLRSLPCEVELSIIDERRTGSSNLCRTHKLIRKWWCVYCAIKLSVGIFIFSFECKVRLEGCHLRWKNDVQDLSLIFSLGQWIFDECPSAFDWQCFCLFCMHRLNVKISNNKMIRIKLNRIHIETKLKNSDNSCLLRHLD